MLKCFSWLPWQERYPEARKISEKDKLTQLVQSAELRMFYRLKELSNSAACRAERNEIHLALANLLAFKTHKLGWPALLPVKSQPLPKTLPTRRTSIAMRSPQG
jgi:hypothetical protein